MGGDGELVRGREAAGRLAWADAYAGALAGRPVLVSGGGGSGAAGDRGLSPGPRRGLPGALQRAQQLHTEAGDPRRAARCALWLAFHLGNAGELAQAGGWLARANRLLEHEPPDCAERGLLLLPLAIQHIVTGDPAAARELSARAAGIGRDAGDDDLVALALQVQGRALVRLGRVGEAMAAFDEAMVAVVAGELSPVVVGTVYCSMLEGCQEILEWRRAREWTEALTAWCGKQPEMVTFSGRCLVHRAEILHLHGAWPEAVEEARRAGERLAQAADSWATGGACTGRRRSTGSWGTSRPRRTPTSRPAAGAWSRSRDWRCCGWPRAGPTRPPAGSAACLAETTDRLGRAKLLPAQVEIMLAVGDVQGARDAAGELTEIAERYDTPALRAVADHARGAMLLAEGDARAALVALRGAWQAWQELEAPYEAARVRVLVGLGCRALGDEEAAAMELEAARTVFAQLGAAPDLARLEALAHREAAWKAHGLTERELQVLRLVATGATNHAIASQLFVAEKTVDRHVSNIFTKLGVASRAAATAYAYQHRLL